DDGTARVWHLHDGGGEEVCRVGKREHPQRWAAFLDGERELITCGYLNLQAAAGHIDIWDAENGKHLRTFEDRSKKGLLWFQVVTRPHARQVLTLGMLGVTPASRAVLWDVGGDGKEVRAFFHDTLDERAGKSPLSAAFSADGKLLVCGERDGRVSVWDA